MEPKLFIRNAIFPLGHSHTPGHVMACNSSRIFTQKPLPAMIAAEIVWFGSERDYRNIRYLSEDHFLGRRFQQTEGIREVANRQDK